MAYAPSQLNPTQTGSAAKLTSSAILVRTVIIQANVGNAGTIYLGNASVTSSVYGVALAAGQSISLGDVDSKIDLSTLYINGTSGDGVSVLYF